jgi:preprotein translocase SecE subunit
MSFIQYIKDTKVELKHVAWPTQTQTIIYTVLVIAISLLVALYIGFFDFFFTRGLEEVIGGSSGSVPLETTHEPSLPEGIDFSVVPEMEGGDTSNVQVMTNDSELTENLPEEN